MQKILAVLAVLAMTIIGPAAATTGPRTAAPVKLDVARTAATAPVGAQMPIAAGAKQMTAQDVEAWLDGFVPLALSRGSIAGAVVVVVKDGKILVQKGYGYSDLAKRTPVDPVNTLFRPGSVSKLFTWTAVMQLVEQGKIDLDADVNTYLDFKIPPRNGKPITMRHIMTHTAGFEEQIKALITAKPPTRSLGAQLKNWVPNRVFDAGTTPAYSNYATGLAGYIVERVSGTPFDDYMDRQIFAPLGMTKSTFRQPLPSNLLPLMSKGYRDASQKPAPFEFVSLPPAGSMSAPGSDMAKFMIAHLQQGRLGDAQILKPETAAMMHNTRTQLMPPLQGIRLGFYDHDVNGRRVIAHGGDTQLFHTDLVLFLDDNVGIYTSYNSSGVRNGGFRQLLLEGFADRYFPVGQPDPRGTVDKATAAKHAAMISGNYISQRSPYSSFFKLTQLIGQIAVTTNPDGTISMPLMVNAAGQPKRYREVEPFVWREVGGKDRIGAVVKDGRVVRMTSELFSGIMVFDRAPAGINAAWLVPALVASIIVVLLSVILWPVTALVRRRYSAPFPLEGHRARGYRLSRIASILLLVTLGAWLWVVSAAGDPAAMEKLTDGTIRAVHALTLVATIAGVVAAGYNLYALFTGKSGWFGKLWGIVLLLACLMLLYTAYVGNLFNFAVNY